MLTNRRIDLHLPSGWAACTPEELEAIVSAQSAVQFFAMPAQHEEEVQLKQAPWKIECFLRLAELVMVDGPNPEVPVEEQYITVQHINTKTQGWTWLRRKTEQNEPFVLYLWQIHYWIDKQLKWLDAKPTIPTFPYPVWKNSFRTFHGPKTYLANWKWAQYRIAQDYLQYYFKVVEMVQKRLPFSKTKEEQQKLVQQLRTAKALFLATIYCRKVKTIDEETGLKKREYTYLANQSSDNSRYFQSFPDIQFQVILLWWTSTMQRLHTLYPKCFQADNTDKKKKKTKRQQDPLELYAQLTATLEKYIGTNEQELDKRTFEVVLRHLNSMVLENEAMKKINRKNKSKSK